MYKNVLLYCRNELSWRYQTLLQSLERKKTEVEQLSQEFESKIRAKEVYCITGKFGGELNFAIWWSISQPPN